MRNTQFRLDAIMCLQQVALVIAGFAFVDETDNINEVKPVNTNGEDILNKQQRVIDTRESALRTTWRALHSISHTISSMYPQKEIYKNMITSLRDQNFV